MTRNANIGKQIKKLRAKYGWSQPQLADKLNVSKQTISNWETNLKSPRMGALQKMSDLFNVSIGYITDGDEDNDDMVQKISSISSQLVPDRQQNVYNFASSQLKEQLSTPSFINLQAKKQSDTREIIEGRETAAGEPIPGSDQDINAVETIVQKRDVPESANEIVTVAGDSMEPDFPEYSQIFVHWQPSVDNGELALVHVRDEGVTFKKVYIDQQSKKIVLHSLNPAYKDRYFDADDIRVIGKVING